MNRNVTRSRTFALLAGLSLLALGAEAGAQTMTAPKYKLGS